MNSKEYFRPIIDNFYSTLTNISPILNTQIRYLRINKKFANLKNPKTFSEKISWLKLYKYRFDPLIKKCADKWLVREYLKECGLENLLNDVYKIYKTPEEIDWQNLPDKFVLKWNFGSGYNYICTDKNKIDICQATAILKNWQNKKYWLLYSEFQYKVDCKYILCERYLQVPGDKELLDYKFYCFNGEPKAVLVISRKDSDKKKAVFMDLNWKIISGVKNKYKYTFKPDRPKSLTEMIKAAQTLSKPFPFVRVDFYECNGKPIFGEMTFTPAAGILPAETLINGKDMGELINI